MIVYLHGLNSAGSSGKAAILRESLPSIQVISPTYPAHQAEQAIQHLTHELSCLLRDEHYEAEPRILVGSSMGGIYAGLADLY